MLPDRLLTPAKLRWQCPVDDFGFTTTDTLEDLDEVLGQARALEAIQFGIGIQHEGYNLFVIGSPGVGKRTIVGQVLSNQASRQSTPDDWCYVQDFQQDGKSSLLQLPAGTGVKLERDMEHLVEQLQTAIQEALAMEAHQGRIEQIEQEAKQESEEAFTKLADKARDQGIQLVRTPAGFALAPLKGDEIVSPEEFEQLSADEKQRIESVVAALQAELQEIVEEVPLRRHEAREKIRELNREATRLAVSHALKQFKTKYADLPQVVEYLDAVYQDVTEHADDLQKTDEPLSVVGIKAQQEDVFQRYAVNVLVDNSSVSGAPVVYEDHPSYQNLLGRVEHLTHMGTLFTNFTLIRPGALHRANGGYLVVDARRLLQQPYAWDGLKRALFAKRIKIESLAESLSLVSTVSLEPQPVPLDVKIVLLGDRLLYYLLFEYDTDFAELFKVCADFNDDFDRTGETCQLYARLIAMLVRQNDLKPFDAAAVGSVIEHAARLAGDSEKVTAQLRTIADLLREADYWASQTGQQVVGHAAVNDAIAHQLQRSSRAQHQLQEQVERDVLKIATSGTRVGQVNGLSVHELGNVRFGRPTRISATTRLGRGEVIDIEREVELGGAIHSKGVLILTSFLAARFARDHALSLHASLVFEQSYGPIEGDSASLAELCVLLSSLAKIPLRQSLAVTGSVNQQGEVQAVGGVNEKIEGFFDLCQARGLTGEQGVVIPKSNVQHLMLRREVVEAASRNLFSVYAVETVDEAIAMLTGVEAGKLGDDARYPTNTVNAQVSERLREMFHKRQELNRDGGQQSSND